MQVNGGSFARLFAGTLIILTASAKAAAPIEASLLELANEHFHHDLTLAEERMFVAAAKGELADCRSGADKEDDPAVATTWGKERLIRSNRLKWLCTDPIASTRVAYRGVLVAGARFDGLLDLQWARITFPLDLQRCSFPESMVLIRCNLRGLNLNGTYVKELRADGLQVETDVFLTGGFKAGGKVDFFRAMIGGDLDCNGGQFFNTNAFALNADGAKIGGTVFLSHGFNSEGTVGLVRATIGGNLHCDNAQIVKTNGDAIALAADGAEIMGSLYFRKGRVEGEVRIPAVVIGGDLQCDGASFVNARAPSLNAYGAKIKGAVFFRTNFMAGGEVQMTEATLDRGLHCNGGQFFNTNAFALKVEGARITGAVNLCDGFLAVGKVSFVGSAVVGQINCRGGQFVNTKDGAFSASGATIEGSAFLHNAKFNGGVRLTGITVRGQLTCNGSESINAGSFALDAGAAKIGLGVDLANFTTQGEVSLLRADIGRNLNCDGGRFANASANCLSMDGATIGGSVFLRNGFKAEGIVRLITASIVGDLDFSKGQLFNAQATVLFADKAKIGGSVIFGNVQVKGEARLLGVTVGGDLDCSGGHFFNTNGIALNADSAEIKNNVILREFEVVGHLNFFAASIGRGFEIRGAKLPTEAVLDLRLTKVGTLLDSEMSWPKLGNLFLDGFVYDRIVESTLDAKSRISWIQRQPADQFLPQPYEQLATVLRNMGHEDAAKEVMIEKNWKESLHEHSSLYSPWGYSVLAFLSLALLAVMVLEMTIGQKVFFGVCLIIVFVSLIISFSWDDVSDFIAWCWDIFFGNTAGFGYEPWNAFMFSLLFIVVGTFLFRLGKRHGLILADSELDAPLFNPFIYSLETFLPLLELGIAEHFRLNAKAGKARSRKRMRLRADGSLLRVYLWCHTIVGWFLTTFWVGGLTGLLKS